MDSDNDLEALVDGCSYLNFPSDSFSDLIDYFMILPYSVSSFLSM